MPNDPAKDYSDEIFESFPQDCRIRAENEFADWCNEMADLSPDFKPQLKEGIKADIELQPLRWLNLGAALINRKKPSLFDSYLPYTLFQIGAEIFLKGMWLCQFEECRLLADGSYICENTRNNYSMALKDFGHDLLKIVSALQQVGRYRNDAHAVRFLKINESIIRRFYFPLYESDRKQNWANCRYPKHFYDDSANHGNADEWKQHPHQWLVVELFEQMKRQIPLLWDFPQ